jgi:hypothetical protein
MSAAEKLLGRLSRVKAYGPERGAAACPICQSKNGRPISYRLMGDGRVLLHAFCGCDTGDVLQALGLRFSDLFSESLGDYKPERHPFNPLQLLQSVAFEVIVVELIAWDMVTAGTGDPERAQRLSTAAQRLTEALVLIGESPVPDEIKRIRRADIRLPETIGRSA